MAIKKQCPVCHHKNPHEATACLHCGWHFKESSVNLPKGEFSEWQTAVKARVAELDEEEKQRFIHDAIGQRFADKGDEAASKSEEQRKKSNDYAGSGCMSCLVPFPFNYIIRGLDLLITKYPKLTGLWIALFILFILIGMIFFLMNSVAIPEIAKENQQQEAFSICYDSIAALEAVMIEYFQKQGQYIDMIGNQDNAQQVARALGVKCPDNERCHMILVRRIEDQCGNLPVFFATEDRQMFELRFRMEEHMECDICVSEKGVEPKSYSGCSSDDAWKCMH